MLEFRSAWGFHVFRSWRKASLPSQPIAVALDPSIASRSPTIPAFLCSFAAFVPMEKMPWDGSFADSPPLFFDARFGFAVLDAVGVSRLVCRRRLVNY